MGYYDDYDREIAAYDRMSEDWRYHTEHAFDQDPEEVQTAMRRRAIGFRETANGRWYERRRDHS